jgi:hypothetical protein
MTIADNVAEVRARVAAAAERAGRDPVEVTIVAATKYVSDVDVLRQVLDAGITDLGENTARALVAKSEALGAGACRWHYLGSVQTNKVKLLDGVHLVQSVDRAREAEALERRAEATGGSFDVLLEVSLAGEATKQGADPGEIDGLLAAIGSLERVTAKGLMFVAPQAENAEDVRWLFTKGRRLSERYRSEGLSELSMGMTEDFEVAVEEGATIVRIGRAIFRES